VIAYIKVFKLTLQGFQYSVHLQIDYITKLCRKQAKIIKNNGNANVRNIGQGEPDIENLRGLNLVAVKRTTVEVFRLLL
jgi:hypothetical protein